ncbi:hypothetical protein DDZ13_07605 [Coraliomargarita sinensis]|uniref:Uncharacterized protein n=2 Tax=Coraliomargarita sinensis TaxID=2174842 RepID=A0A317ZKP7_9BACT|nr:hypothetical protein DDZ13_07605 [Coraliomargarita sinensis]
MMTGASLPAKEAASGKGEGQFPQGDLRVTETELKFPGLVIDRETQEIRMDATVCLDSGILEYVVCRKGTFEHESIFVTEVKAEILHTALLLVGLEPFPMTGGLKETWWRSARKAEKSLLRIDVEWAIGDSVVRENIANMFRRNTGNSEASADGERGGFREDVPEGVSSAWVFTGSKLRMLDNGERHYTADSVGTVVGIWANQNSVIQYGKKTLNPYRGKNQGMAVNEYYVPELGTKVQLVFSKYTPFDAE